MDAAEQFEGEGEGRNGIEWSERRSETVSFCPKSKRYSRGRLTLVLSFFPVDPPPPMKVAEVPCNTFGLRQRCLKPSKPNAEIHLDGDDDGRVGRISKDMTSDAILIPSKRVGLAKREGISSRCSSLANGGRIELLTTFQ